jgi:hypothetical protein
VKAALKRAQLRAERKEAQLKREQQKKPSKSEELAVKKLAGKIQQVASIVFFLLQAGVTHKCAPPFCVTESAGN